MSLHTPATKAAELPSVNVLPAPLHLPKELLPSGWSRKNGKEMAADAEQERATSDDPRSTGKS